jgi:hypothetical protein
MGLIPDWQSRQDDRSNPVADHAVRFLYSEIARNKLEMNFENNICAEQNHVETLAFNWTRPLMLPGSVRTHRLILS